MKDIKDCLLIGHNEMLFSSVENNIKIMGIDNPTYRDLSCSFIEYENIPMTLCDIYNYVHKTKNTWKCTEDRIHSGSVFSLSIAYLGTFLDCHNLTFDFVNSFNRDKSQLEKLLTENQYHTVAIPTTFYTHYYPILEIVSFLKNVNPSVKIIVGGPFVSNKIKENLKTAVGYFNKINADFYVYSSQGESTLINIINSIKSDQDFNKINNLFFKINGEYIKTPVLSENNYLGTNTVNWQLFKSELPSMINVRSSVSCPFNCSFCGFPERAGKHYSIKVEELEKELNTLKETNVKTIFFTDDTFNIPLPRFKEILRMMIKNKYQFKWSSYFRCQFSDRESLDLMAEAGCEGVNLGIESGSQKILNNMNKKVTIEAYNKGLGLLQEYNFLKLGTFIIGFPGETEETVQETIQFIENSNLDYYSYGLWFCDPITPIYQEREKYKIVGSQFNWSHATMDSKTALNLLEKSIVKITNPTLLIASYLGNLAPFLLHHQENIEFNQIKKILSCFRDGLAEKFNNKENSQSVKNTEICNKLRSAILES